MNIRFRHILAIIIGVLLAYLILGATLPFLRHKQPSTAFKDAFSLDDYTASQQGSERIRCIDDNLEALIWRIRLIQEAQNEIIMSTYAIDTDNSGIDIMSALYHAADRNVSIRILVDGISGNQNLKGDHYFNALISHPNVEVKFYNPVNLLKPWELNLRMHDKYLIADDKLYILGGRNTNDFFLGEYTDKVNIDRDLLIFETMPENKDTSIHQLQSYFDQIWELPCNKKMEYKKNSKRVTEAKTELQKHYQKLMLLYPLAFQQIDFFEATLATNKVTLLTNPKQPINKEPQLWYMLHQLMMNRDQVVIQTPYIICSNDMYTDLTSLSSSTDTVQIITNSPETGANPWGCSDYLNQKKAIINTGVQMYEFSGQRSNHTKTILIDDRLSIVGSYNFDMRSTYLDTEVMLAVDSTELNQELSTYTQMAMQQSRRAYSDGSYISGSLYVPTQMSLGKKIFYSVLRVIIIPFRYLL